MARGDPRRCRGTVTFFTDAVAAIALTLLAIELPVPTGTTPAQVLHSFAGHHDDIWPS